jgi:hypothetical protein
MTPQAAYFLFLAQERERDAERELAASEPAVPGPSPRERLRALVAARRPARVANRKPAAPRPA